MAVVKKAGVWVLVAFLVYYLATKPDASAHAVRGAGQAIQRLFAAVQVFFTQLTR